MEEVKVMFTADNFYALVNLYNSKLQKFYKKDFCEVIGIGIENTISYNKLITFLKDINAITISQGIKNKLIIIDRKKLELFLLQSIYYKNVDKFIHNTGIGWMTP